MLKKMAILISLMMISLSITSQTTYPKVIKYNKDTVVAFTVLQAKSIAEDLENGKMYEALNVEFTKKDSLNSKIINNLDNQVLNYKAEVKNFNLIDSSRVKQIDNLNCITAIQKKQIKTERRQKNLTITASILIMILGAAAYISK